jgi:hypothetical protein
MVYFHPTVDWPIQRVNQKGLCMLARLSLGIVVSIVLGIQQTAGASPITYDFTGSNVNGSQQISGSFTINADPIVPFVGAQSVTENGSDVSITVNAGGHV